MFKNALCMALVSLAFFVPDLQAQEDPEPQYGVWATFHVPYGEDSEAIQWWFENWLVPQWRLNPNILSFRVGSHLYGADAGQVFWYREYAEFADINASCGQPCADWRDENRPEEGTPEREAWDARRETYWRLVSSHSDQIYGLRHVN